MIPRRHRKPFLLNLDDSAAARPILERVPAVQNQTDQRDWVHTFKGSVTWITALLRAALMDEADAIHLMRSHDESALLQLLYCADPNDSTHKRWFPLVPMVKSFMNEGVTHLRQLAEMGPVAKEGRIRFVFRGEHMEALCKFEGPNDIAIYFGSARPILKARGQSLLD